MLRQQITRIARVPIRALSTSSEVSTPATFPPPQTASSSHTPPPTQASTPKVVPTGRAAKPTKLPYIVSRNSRGNLPVYTDIRNGGTKVWTQIGSVTGNIVTFRNDIASTLFPADSPQAARLKSRINKDKVILEGGKWMNEVKTWLLERGF